MKFDFENDNVEHKEPHGYIDELGNLVWVVRDINSPNLDDAKIIEISTNGDVEIYDTYDYCRNVDFYNVKNQKVFVKGDKITLTF